MAQDARYAALLSQYLRVKVIGVVGGVNIVWADDEDDPDYQEVDDNCPACEGTGIGVDGRCNTCDGSGVYEYDH